MKRSFIILAWFLFLFSINSFSQFTVYIPEGSKAVFDPQKVDPSALPGGMEIIDIAGEKYLRVLVDSLSSILPIETFLITPDVKFLRCRMKYKAGTSGYDIDMLTSRITFLDSKDKNVGYLGCFGSTDFVDLYIFVTPGVQISKIMFSILENTKFSPIKGDYVYISKIETVNDYNLWAQKGSWSEEGNIKIISETSWSISADQPWLTLDKVSGNGNANVKYSITQNLYDERTCNITISSTKFPDQILTLVQQEGFSVNETEIELYGKEGSKGTFVIHSFINWTASTDQSWLKVSPDKGSETAIVTVVASENTGTTRIGTVTISAKGIKDRSIKIIQEGWSDPVIKQKSIAFWGQPEIDGFWEDVWNFEPLKIERAFNRVENPTISAMWGAMFDWDNLYVIVEVFEKNHYPGWKAGGSNTDFDMPVFYFDWNDTLNDGLGPSTNFSGHYMFAEGFKEDSYFKPITITPSAYGDRNPGGTFCYGLYEEFNYDNPEDTDHLYHTYQYELKIPFSNFFDKNGKQMSSDIAAKKNEIGFDIILIDQDEGLSSSPQRAVWNSDQKDCYENMDNAGVIYLHSYFSNNKNIKLHDENKIRIFPNPNKGIFSIDISTIEDASLLTIYNILGEKIYRSTVSDKTVIKADISKFQKGIYLIRIKGKNEEFFKKVITN